MSHFAAAMKSPLPIAASAAVATGGDGKSPLFCPKPRRPVAPLRCHHDMDLLDLLLSKVAIHPSIPLAADEIDLRRAISLTFFFFRFAGGGDAVLRLAAAARVEPGGPRQPVRPRLPADAGVVAGATGGAAGGGAPPDAAAGGGDADVVAARQRRVHGARAARVPAGGRPRRGF
jgi:hypothetical protein